MSNEKIADVTWLCMAASDIDVAAVYNYSLDNRLFALARGNFGGSLLFFLVSLLYIFCNTAITL